ncbi:hypothetical protein HYH02_006584 [Chlamydomonas schloesseri]|uniref:Splicing factor 45 n=1 Tax=Chlamydomonas schloesseri TaxID=2026947 RepID=A0A835T517_9CHLO|nr:hypothetical protein HYH02_006584 [Chlamydomonas schloesseri]|eukprot:KAG2439057.1 hypothetical protein HYH02_006584 [Chlamydomonas schloesseri]
MSLYGDLPQAKNSSSDAAGAGWPDPKLLAPASLKKPAAVAPAFKPPPSVLRAAAAGGAGGPGRGGPSRGIPITGRTGGRGPPNTLAVDGAASGGGSASDGARSLTPGATPGGGPAVASTSAPGAAGGAAASGPALGGSSIFTRNDGRPIEDEYDPMRPNDYEEVIAARERARKAAEAEAERLAKQREAEAEAERLRKQEEERARAAAAVLAAAAPPGASSGAADGDGGGGGVMSMEEYARRRAAMGMTGDDAFARRGRMSVAQAAEAAMGGAAAGGGGGGGGSMGPPGSGEGGAAKGMSLAQKLLEKMGWREGEGLGRNRQGISNPLMAQKTNQRAAVIVEAPSLPPGAIKPPSDQPDAKRPKGSQLTGAPSRVICMRNMVGPGQVDEELEEEVGQELTKYGKVLDVLIFEVTTPGYVEEEAVRIFVQFERVESATKAAVDLQGRFFAGRQVRVSFFPEERFTSTDLAPKAGEFD